MGGKQAYLLLGVCTFLSLVGYIAAQNTSTFLFSLSLSTNATTALVTECGGFEYLNNTELLISPNIKNINTTSYSICLVLYNCNNITIRGVGPNTVFNGSFTTAIYGTPLTSLPSFPSSNLHSKAWYCTNVSISNLCFRASVLIADGSNLAITNCTFTGNAYSANVTTLQVGGLQDISHNTFYGNFMVNSTDGSNVSITNNFCMFILSFPPPLFWV
jgi:hypothetical protein